MNTDDKLQRQIRLSSVFIGVPLSLACFQGSGLPRGDERDG